MARSDDIRIGPVRTGRYGFDPGNERRIEALVNVFAPRVGFPRVAEDDALDATDADRVVRVQRYLFSTFVCDRAERAAQVERFDVALDGASLLAEEERVPVTAEQMWVSLNQDKILARLPAVHRDLVAGTLKPCPSELLSARNLSIGAAIAAGWWLLRKGTA